jgi:hypothetical protein
MQAQYGMWKDRRAIEAQEYDSYLMALRVGERLNDSNIIVTNKGLDLVNFFYGSTKFTFLNYGNWIQPNWDVFRQNAVETAANMWPLMGLPKSLSPKVQFNEFKNPAGGHAGWEYLTGSQMTLGNLGAAKQWAEEGRITGTLMMSESAQLQMTCKDYRIKVRTAISSASSENTGSFEVLRGLNRVALLPTRDSQIEPRYLQLRFTPSEGQAEDHVIAPGDLYTIPVCGWLEEASLTRFDITGGSPVQRSIVPTIYTHLLDVESVYYKGKKLPATRYRRYRSYVSLPPGNHQFAFYASEPCTISMSIGDKQMKWDGPIDGNTTRFTLNSEEVNGKLIEITKTDGEKPADFSFEVVPENRTREVPPYFWFTPYSGPPFR